MGELCIDCGERLSFTRRVLLKDRCAECEERCEKRIARERELAAAHERQAVQHLGQVLGQLRLGADLDVVLPRIRRAIEITPLPKDQALGLLRQAISAFLNEAAADGVVTHEEDILLARIFRELGVSPTPDQAHHYQLAAVAAGLMPKDPNPVILVDPDESPYFHAPAELLTERVIKEFQIELRGASMPVGSSDFSAALGSGTARDVVVGRTTEVADRGSLSITSNRVVFTGAREVLELPHRQLIGLRLFGDGLGFQLTHRKGVPMFRIGPKVNEIAAVIANVAAQVERGTFVKPQRPVVEPIPVSPLPPLLKADGFDDPEHRAPRHLPGPLELLTLHGEAKDTTAEPPDPEIEFIFSELERYPKTGAAVARLKSLFSLSGAPNEELIAFLEKAHAAGVSGGLPPALIPQPPGSKRDRRPVREVPSEIEQLLDRLVALGLTERQVADLRDDYRCRSCEAIQLMALEQALPQIPDDWLLGSLEGELGRRLALPS